MYSSITPSKPCALFTRLFHLIPTAACDHCHRVRLSSLCFLYTNEQVYAYCPFHSLFSPVVDTHSHFLLFCSTISPGSHSILKSLWSKYPSPHFHFSCTNYLLEKLAVCPVEFPTGRSGLCVLHPRVMAEPVLLSLYFLPLGIALRGLISCKCGFSGKRLRVKRRPWWSKGGLCVGPNACLMGRLWVCSPDTVKWLAGSLHASSVLSKIVSSPPGRRRGRQRTGWLDGITNSWTWVWASSGREWRTGKPGVLHFMASHSLTRLSD